MIHDSGFPDIFSGTILEQNNSISNLTVLFLASGDSMINWHKNSVWNPDGFIRILYSWLVMINIWLGVLRHPEYINN